VLPRTFGLWEHAEELRQQAECVQGAAAALEMGGLGGQLRGAEHMRPVEPAANTKSGPVGMGDRCRHEGASDGLHRRLQACGSPRGGRCRGRSQL
jgi:hypothetical protein